MPPKSDNVQKLLAAEEQRNKIVADAKARKQTKVKQAKLDAEANVAEFRREKEADYEQFRTTQLSGAGIESSKSVEDTDKQIVVMKKLASQRTEKVANMMMDLVCHVPL